jgi:hypothetical protein
MVELVYISQFFKANSRLTFFTGEVIEITNAPTLVISNILQTFTSTVTFLDLGTRITARSGFDIPRITKMITASEVFRTDSPALTPDLPEPSDAVDA